MKRITILMTALLLTVTPELDAKAHRIQAFGIMTYNIRYDNPGDGDDNWKFRKSHIATQIRENAPAIVCIQEGLATQVLDLTNMLPGYGWTGVGRDDGNYAGEFSAIFYATARFKMLETGNFWLSETPETPSLGWDAACIRICTWAKLEDRKSKAEFAVFNTHFDHVGKVARESSALLISERIKNIAGDLPVLLTGDFNAPDSDTVYGIITQEGGLLDSQISCQTQHEGPDETWWGFHPKAVEQPERIDFIFASPGLKVLKHATLKDILDNGHFPSDHLPVLAVVKL
jgi:endonuclease/exonuclease/phosphatase family metal-dependent hydrolase